MKKAAKTPKNKRLNDILVSVNSSPVETANEIPNDTLLTIIEQKSTVIHAQQQRIQILEERLRLERSRHFGPSSEKSNADQSELFNEAELAASELESQDDEDAPAADLSDNKRKKKGGRKGFSKHTPRVQRHIHLSDEEKAGAIDTFFTVVKEELDIQPAKAQVIEYLQEKAVFVEQDKRVVKSAAMPKHPLQKCTASISLLAFIIVSKYCDGLPLYRLENILKRYGGEITRTSMATWMIRIALQLQPLVNLIRDHQLSYDYIQADETRIKVLKEPGKPPTSDKWMWLIRGGPPDKPAIVFNYDPSRSKGVALRLFDGYRGYFQCDGYGSYDSVCKQEGVTRLGCMDHARRKFVEAEKSAEPEKGKKHRKVSKATVAKSKINKLYVIEKEIRELGAEEKYRHRQERSLPLLQALKQWLETAISKVSKDGATYTAMYYMLNQWDSLVAYCDDGRLHISNVLAENAIRPFVIGRKAWMFSDTPKGAHASAVLYSLVETAKANGLEPYEYFRHILKDLAYAETVEDFEALLPWRVKGKI